MKPYLAVLFDSFSEALASRVLWALFLAWTLVLAAIAPFGYILEKGMTFTASDIRDRGVFIDHLARAAKGSGPQDQQAVVKAFNPQLLDKLKDRKEDSDQNRAQISRNEVIDSLNLALEKPDLYDEKAWPTAARRKAIAELLDVPQDSRSTLQQQELNRKLIELAFESDIKKSQGESLWFGYAGMKIGSPLPITRRQANQFVETFALSGILKLGLGVFAIFVAIVVTSPLIPDMFQTGSLHLLLSKPINRSLLFLSKFVGGCIFVLLNIAYLLFGLYWIAGLRFDIWNAGLLWCIPIFVLIFVIYYSISSLAGVIWKNAIVCVVVAIVFWMMCFFIGTVREGVRPWIEVYPEIGQILQVEDRIVSVNQQGALLAWDDGNRSWQPLTGAGPPNSKVLGPILLPDKRELAFSISMRGPFGGGARVMDDRLQLGVLESKDNNTNEKKLDGKNNKPSEDSWMRVESGPKVPSSVKQYLPWKDTLIAISETSIMELNLEKMELAEQVPTTVFGFQLPVGKIDAFESVTPPAWLAETPLTATVSSDGESIVLVARGKLQVLTSDEKGKFKVASELVLPGDASLPSMVVATTDSILVARTDSPLVIYDAKTLEAKQEIALPDGEQIRSIEVSSNGDQFAAVTQGGELWMLDTKTGEKKVPQVAGQGKVSSVGFAENQRLLIAHNVDQVTEWNWSDGKIVRELRPIPTTFQRIYGYIINPIYSVSPKPAALDQTIQFFLTGDKAQNMTLMAEDMDATQVKFDPWRPLIDNSIFVAIILTISCIYLTRQEF